MDVSSHSVGSVGKLQTVAETMASKQRELVLVALIMVDLHRKKENY